MNQQTLSQQLQVGKSAAWRNLDFRQD